MTGGSLSCIFSLFSFITAKWLLFLYQLVLLGFVLLYSALFDVYLWINQTFFSSISSVLYSASPHSLGFWFFFCGNATLHRQGYRKKKPKQTLLLFSLCDFTAYCLVASFSYFSLLLLTLSASIHALHVWKPSWACFLFSAHSKLPDYWPVFHFLCKFHLMW